MARMNCEQAHCFVLDYHCLTRPMHLAFTNSTRVSCKPAEQTFAMEISRSSIGDLCHPQGRGFTFSRMVFCASPEHWIRRPEVIFSSMVARKPMGGFQ